MVGKELNAKLMEKLQQAGQHSQMLNILESEFVDYFLLRLRPRFGSGKWTVVT
jgi:hypothetical protein